MRNTNIYFGVRINPFRPFEHQAPAVSYRPLRGTCVGERLPKTAGINAIFCGRPGCNSTASDPSCFAQPLLAKISHATTLPARRRVSRWPIFGKSIGVVAFADEMQRNTRWLNLFETAFLLKPISAKADYHVRIFTLQRELAFAGHPT